MLPEKMLRHDKLLKHHWSGTDVSSLYLDSETSNRRYKYHLARLVDTYVGNRKFIQDVKIGNRVFLDNQKDRALFLQRLPPATFTPKEIMKRREGEWDDRVLVPNSNPRRSDQKLRSSCPESSPHTHTASRSQPSLPRPKPDEIRHRCIDPTLTAEEMVFNGLYRLNDPQRGIYEDFVDMLTAFDPHDMVKVLEDAMKDAREKSLLSEYGGTSELAIDV